MTNILSTLLRWYVSASIAFGVAIAAALCLGLFPLLVLFVGLSEAFALVGGKKGGAHV